MKISGISKIKSRIKLWKLFDWTFPGSGIGYFNRNHSLNDSCGQCKQRTKEQRAKNKRERSQNKIKV